MIPLWKSPIKLPVELPVELCCACPPLWKVTIVQLLDLMQAPSILGPVELPVELCYPWSYPN